jgi:hypothetical protein
VAALLWLALLAVLLAVPALTADPGEALTRNTIRLSLLFYGGAAVMMPRLGAPDWAAQTPRGRLTRACWVLAWLAYLIHLGMAFHYYHGWSHDDAVRRTERESGFGPGIYLSHAFTLVWLADVVFWLGWPRRYAARSPWVGVALHGFLVFMIFNATVVFGHGWIRWAGAALLALVAAAVMLRWRGGWLPRWQEPG